jgi:hypothetical protein
MSSLERGLHNLLSAVRSGEKRGQVPSRNALRTAHATTLFAFSDGYDAATTELRRLPGKPQRW